MSSERLKGIKGSLHKVRTRCGDGNQMDDNTHDISSIEDILWDIVYYLEDKEKEEEIV